ncbi:MAG: 2-hydroxy-3-keto-5-methylthiopentenyl-phosphate phosphatase [Gaiellaceae bacterium]|jgi:2-hydroxy-3-keto-5-methylthiopentenyl-1-phosphate phosphatase|nr:2-hydroxy-3-keto-5-methylthiopentenyl-phosphate phosphatase [Gaiellaceae bacterium]
MRLILDWDGTSTLDDTMDALVREFGSTELLEVHLDRRPDLTLHQIIEDELGSIRVPLAEAQRWLVENVRLRPGFHELVAAHRPLLLSSNVRQLIEPVLEREGLAGLELIANDLEDGWVVKWRDESICEACGQPCKRGTLPDGEIVYVGDGFSDRCAALAADHVFATGSLARYLEAEGVAFTEFDDLHQVAAGLVSLV